MPLVIIKGLASPMIHQSLPENKTRDLQAAHNQVYSSGLAQHNVSAYKPWTPLAVHTAAMVTLTSHRQQRRHW